MVAYRQGIVAQATNNGGAGVRVAANIQLASRGGREYFITGSGERTHRQVFAACRHDGVGISMWRQRADCNICRISRCGQHADVCTQSN